MSLIRKHVAVLQAWACLALVLFGEIIYFGTWRLKTYRIGLLVDISWHIRRYRWVGANRHVTAQATLVKCHVNADTSLESRVNPGVNAAKQFASTKIPTLAMEPSTLVPVRDTGRWLSWLRDLENGYRSLGNKSVLRPRLRISHGPITNNSMSVV